MVAAVAVVLVAGPAAASDHTPEDVAAEVAASVMSPFCPGVTLHDCPSAEADEWRRRIAAWARAGAGKAEIVDRLEREFGPGVRATPAGAGGTAAWLVPAAAVAGGIGLAWWLARSWASRPRPEPPEPPSPEERRRVASELARYRSELR